MNKILIFGNSGAGKSTLAKKLKDELKLEHLDLDTLAWQDTNPPVRKPINESISVIENFLTQNKSWVIEGVYADLLDYVSKQASEIIFLNPGVEVCIQNCRSRPWEPHKYSSRDEQDKNLDMLIDWVKKYDTREDEFSLKAHSELYESFTGYKTEKC